MYSEILLHAGLSKTGTTSIQDSCRRHRDTLARQGIVYPRFSAGEHVFQNHSIPLTVALSGAPGRYGLGLRDRFGDEVEQVKGYCRAQFEAVLAAGAGEVLVLSSELLESWRDEDLQALRTRLAAHTPCLRVVVYLRNPESVLESTLQERAKAGAMIDPVHLVGRVKAKLLRLQRNFPGQLELINYHTAQTGPGGLVGSFLTLAHCSRFEIERLSFPSSNQRLSMESYCLIAAVNRAYPAQALPAGEVGQRRRDLDRLSRLPGQPFQIPEFAGSELQRQAASEVSWLESQLGWTFPPRVVTATGPLWQLPTLTALEQLLAVVSERRIRHCIGQFLGAESRALPATREADAKRLAAIARRLEEDCPENPH